MKKLYLGTFVLAMTLVGGYKQQSSDHTRKAMTVRPPTRAFVLKDLPPVLSRWDQRGILISFAKDDEDNPRIWVHDQTGRLISQLSPVKNLSEAQAMNLVDVALTKKGTVLAAGILVNKEKKQMVSALLEFELGGTLKRIIKTDPFALVRMSVDDDGNIWLLGYDWQQLYESSNWTMVHKLSAEGMLLKSSVPRSLFPREPDPLDITGPGIESSSLYFRVVSDKVYAWLPGANQLVVLNLDGQLLQQIKSPFGSMFKDNVKSVVILSMGFLPQGQLVVQARGNNGVANPVGWFFSPDLGQSWFPLRIEADPSASRLVGFTSSREAVMIRKMDVWSAEFCPLEYR